MALFDRETDPAKERDGVPLDFGDYRVTLRRMGGANSAYELELDKALKPYRRAIAVGKMPQSKVDEIVFNVFARTCVTRWETLLSSMRKPPEGATAGPDGFVDGIDLRGKLVPLSVENAVAVYSALPGVFLDQQAAAKGEQLYRLEQQEDDAGN